MPRVRCINPTERNLTLNREYEVLRSYVEGGREYYAIINDRGESENFYTTRFELMEPVTADVPASGRLEIGTRVRIREDLRENRYYGDNDLSFVRDMLQYRGQEAVVTGWDDIDNDWFNIDIDSERWTWCPEMVTVIEETSTARRPEVYRDISQFTEGMRVRVRTGLRDIFNNEAVHNPTYCSSMEHFEGQIVTIRDTSGWYVRVEEDEDEYGWCVEAFESLEGTEDMPEMPVFEIGDVVKVTEGSYIDQIGFIKKKLANGRYEINISTWHNFKSNQLVKANEEEMLNQPVETLIPVPEYAQVTADTQEFRAGVRVKLPTRSRHYDLSTKAKIKEALDSGRDYLTIKRVTTGSDIYLYNDDESSVNKFMPYDLEVLDTKFVQGTLENGHRLKDKNGRSHTYEEYNIDNPLQVLISNNDEYIEYIDSTGWYIRKWHRLVVKPRGTVVYTEYMAMTGEDYVLFKANMTDRKAYLKALFENVEISERNQKVTEQINQYNDAKRRAEEFLTAHAREIEEARRREENKARLRELNALGIWKHHDKSWI